jgi:methionyl-tRNA formyltransferase
MGTPDFAATSLKKLNENGLNIKAVVTSPDKPAGRGQNIRMSSVKEYALEAGLKTIQPTNLKDEAFINELKELNADLFVVVAFRMLPEVVWNMPSLGTINLHGSILPNYRGAAPINWAVINGEKETGVTTFFIEKEIDTGKILFVEKTNIKEEDDAGSVHDRLMDIGANLIVKTVNSIFNKDFKVVAQKELMDGNEKEAPKIFKQDCLIDWNKSSENVFNKIRGLSPYPASYTQIRNKNTGKTKSLKIFRTKKTNSESTTASIKVSDKLLFGCVDYFLEIHELQMEGKKRMKTEDFTRGFDFNDWEIVVN